MTDILTKKQRSRLMSRIKGKDTKPELIFRAALEKRGVKNFILHPKGIDGKPDFYFPAAGIAVFIDGCFWHCCETCYKEPKTNKKFWSEKIKRNTKRDREVDSMLADAGIVAVRFWEHDIEKNAEACATKIEKMITPVTRKCPKVLDLFAGVGGLSEGFINAGCEVVGHVEMDKDACKTLTTRVVYHALKRSGNLDEYKRYLTGEIGMDELIEKHNLYWLKASVIQARIEKGNYMQIIDRIKERLGESGLDLVVGGPPCQAYSQIGRSSVKGRMKNDPRNFLYKYYVTFLRKLKPKIFVFENVPGLLTAGEGRHLKNMRALMKRAGYETDYRVLNAAEYGVPQNRRRIILVGWNEESGLKKYPEFKKVERDYLVEGFLGTLPKLKPDQGEPVCEYVEQSDLLKRLGIVNPDLPYLLDHVTRPHSEKDLEIYKIAVETLEDGRRIKYNQLPKNLKTHKNESGFLDRFKVVDFSSKASHTVIAHIGRDGHYYIHPDKKQNRSLSVREAARLQTFPDDFKFEGSRNSAFKQIGNAVPPMLSDVIAKEILNQMYYERKK